MAKENKFKGILPTVKSLFYGSEAISHEDYTHEQNGGGYFHFHTSNYEFSHKGLNHLVKSGYANNPIGYSVINKIALSQKELNLLPYRNGEPIKNEVIPFDVNQLFFFMVLTGSGILWKRNIAGLGKTYEVINPLFLTENYQRGTFKYTYQMEGLEIPILESDLMFLTISDITRINTRFGIAPLQASLMPMDSLNQMYIADASLLKNKGADILISNGSDTPLNGMDSDEMDEEMNRRIGGARKHGKAVTATAKLDVHHIGRTAKELALWDGYKIKLRDICNVFCVDASHFNDPESKKFANFEEAKKALYNNCILPHLKVITENKELKKELGYDIFIDTSKVDVLQKDQEIRAKKNKINTDAIVGLNTEVQNGNITREIAINILITEWDYEQEEARNYIGERIERETQTDI